jgi:hypothetical protein
VSETELEMVSRHVIQAEGVITNQQVIIAELGRNGHDTTKARALLETFEQTLKVWQLNLDRLTKGF